MRRLPTECFFCPCRSRVVPKDWERIGCIAEVSGRALKADSLTDDAMTPKMCMQYCAGKGYTLAGVEYSKGELFLTLS